VQANGFIYFFDHRFLTERDAGSQMYWVVRRFSYSSISVF